MQVEVSLKCMQTNLGERGFSGFGDFVPFHLPSKWPKFFWTMDYAWWSKIESAQKIHANRGQCEMYACKV